MTAVHAERRLTAVMAADVVGYTQLMGRDEDGPLARLKAPSKELFEPLPLVAEYHGRTVELMGDGALGPGGLQASNGSDKTYRSGRLSGSDSV